MCLCAFVSPGQTMCIFAEYFCIMGSLQTVPHDTENLPVFSEIPEPGKFFAALE